MCKTTYECEVLTPMILRGGNGKTPELRPPTIKGAMRFWWRVFYPFDDVDQMREDEKKLFGGAGAESEGKEDQEKAGKSKFNIKVTVPGKLETGPVSPTPHKGDQRGQQQAIMPPTAFQVSLWVKPGMTVNCMGKEMTSEEVMQEVDNCFEVMAYLGGLGMRSRRGFGAFYIVKKNQKKYEIQSSMIIIKKKITKGKRIQTTLEGIDFGKTYDDYKRLIFEVGKASHDVRDNDDSKWTISDYGYALGLINRGSRQASPLIVSAVPRLDAKNRVRLMLVFTTIRANVNGYGRSKKDLKEMQNEFIKPLKLKSVKRR